MTLSDLLSCLRRVCDRNKITGRAENERPELSRVLYPQRVHAH